MSQTANKRTGRAAFFSIAGTKIGMTKLSPKTTRKLADVTDSTDYDATSDLIWPAQLAVMAPIELSIEGRYNVVTTPANLINTLYTGAAAVAVILNIDASTIYGHGLFDISDFEASIPDDDVVTFTATFKSHSVFTFGS